MANAGSEEMPTSLAAVQAAGAETLSLDLSDAFEQFDPCDKQPAVSPGFGGPMSPDSAQWPFRSPVMSPVPQSPLTFGQAALSPGGVIRKNATGLGIPLVLSGPSMPVPVPSPTVRVAAASAVACTSPVGRATTSKCVVSSPAVRAQGSSTQPVLRPARLSGSPVAMNFSPASLKGQQSPTGWQPLPSPGATIRQNAASFGIPFNLRSTCEAAVPIPVRSPAGGVVAPSPTTTHAPTRTTISTVSGCAPPITAVVPSQLVCAGMTAPAQHTVNVRPGVLAQSGAAAPASSIRAIATPARRVNRGGA